MKRTPLKRRTPLRRHGISPTAVRRVSRYRQRPRDLPRMAWIREQPCAALDIGGCAGRIEADHAGRRGTRQKAPDDTCIPLCQLHHRQRDSFSGPFRTWTGMMMRLWLAELVIRYQQLYQEKLS